MGTHCTSESRYFRKFHGHYAEVALLERILLSALKTPETNMPFSDLFMADRSADHHMMSDWIMHQTMTHGRLQMGIQLSTGKNGSAKRNDFQKRPLHDRDVLQSNDMPDVVRDFLRHNTAILSFPRFKTADDNRARALRVLLSGSSRYQSEMIATTGNRTFNKYGRQVSEVLRFFHAGVVDRIIQYRARLGHHDFSSVNAHGETISGSVYEYQGQPMTTIRLQEPGVRTSPFGHKPKFSRHTPVTYTVPLDDTYLDIYRDMAGVRTQ